MERVSVTSTAGFRERLLRSERLRALLLLGVWGFALVGNVVRRELGGAVMSVNLLFEWSIAVLGLAMAFQGVVLWQIAKYRKSGETVPRWKWLVSAAADISVPFLAMLVLHVYSPQGHYGALSAPAILGVPLVIMLSVLRLKPRVPLWSGVAGALGHFVLVVDTMRLGEVPSHMGPTLGAYSFFLLLTGVAGWMVAKQMRQNVEEAVAEAEAAERVEHERAEMERDLEVARHIQAGLMPSGSPRIDGFDIAGMARPAQQTGGDYYDWQALPDGRLVVVLADVTGHGIGPALVMAVCRAYARASAPGATDSAALLRQVNGLIYSDLSQTGRFITMVIAILSPNGTVELVSAGHGPTMLYRKGTGAVTVFGGDGVPLGIDEGESYGPHTVLQMAEGDVLLLATDGFMEWMKTGTNEQFGMERMERSLARTAGGPAQGVLKGLDSDVQAFAAGAPQGDDTTAVAIKRVIGA